MKLIRLIVLTITALTGALGQQFILSGTLANRPTTCDVPQIYFATDQPITANTFQCVSQNKWTLIGGNITPGLDASNITSGVFNIARIPVGTTSSTVAAGNDSRFNLATNSLQITNNLSDLNNVATARANLGLGTAATQNSSAFDAAGSAAAAQAASLQKANNLSDLSNVATARTNLGLGSAATQNSSAFDAAGAAAAAQAASLQKASNLSDLSNPSTARTNLGLGSAATHASTDFDAAGAASALLSASQTWSGTNTYSGAINLTGSTFPVFAHQPVAWQTEPYKPPFTIQPAPLQLTKGTAASPATDIIPSLACQSFINLADSGADFYLPYPACITAWGHAEGTAGSTTGQGNVSSLSASMVVDAGCGGTCGGNSVGGIAISSVAQVNANGVAAWGANFDVFDNGFTSGISGLEIDTFPKAASRINRQVTGLTLANTDQSSNTQSVANDYGIFVTGYGKGIVFSSSGGSAITGSWNDIVIDNSGTSGTNANTTVLSFAASQPGPYKVGLDFSNATFSDSAIKNASIKQPQILSGISNGSGFEHFSACSGFCDVTVTPCTTAATAGSTCSVTITLPVAMSDTAFHPVCSGVSIASGVPILSVSAKTTTSFTVVTQAATASAAGYGEYDCMVAHN